MNNKFKDAKEAAEKEVEIIGQKRHDDFGKGNINDNNMIDEMNINSSLAKSICDFLEGRTNKIPSREFFRVVYLSSKGYAISMGYGITISKTFEIIHTSPLKDGYERIDTITPEKYYALKSKPGFKEEMYFYADREMYRNINVNRNNIFDVRRVEYLQKYLNDCRDYIESLEGEKKL